MYQKASKLKLRVQTPQGMLSVEQLWDLTTVSLDKVAVRLQKEYKESGAKSFLDTKSKKNKEIKLAFDIVLDILNNKVDAQGIAAKSAETKAHNQKILGLIADAENTELKGKSVDELKALLKK